MTPFQEGAWAMVQVTKEQVAKGWYLLHLPPNDNVHRVLEVQHEGPDGTWRICPYGYPELETFRPTLKACVRLAEQTATGQPWPQEKS